MKSKLVRVVWEDTTGKSGWQPTSDAAKMKTSMVETLGFVIQEDTRHLRICASRVHHDPDGDGCSDVCVIPKSLIRKRESLMAKTKSKKQVGYLMSKNSPLSGAQKSKLKGELHSGAVKVRKRKRGSPPPDRARY